MLASNSVLPVAWTSPVPELQILFSWAELWYHWIIANAIVTLQLLVNKRLGPEDWVQTGLESCFNLSPYSVPPLVGYLLSASSRNVWMVGRYHLPKCQFYEKQDHSLIVWKWSRDFINVLWELLHFKLVILGDWPVKHSDQGCSPLGH